MVAHDAANVSEHFKKAPADHSNSEADESFRQRDLDQECQKREQEKSQEGAIGNKGRTVWVYDE